uniref:Uncharacterized protein n=1 Tax=Arundo donax TaxID=35708 RepID=A0A0A9DZ49_ARUDO
MPYNAILAGPCWSSLWWWPTTHTWQSRSQAPKGPINIVANLKGSLQCDKEAHELADVSSMLGGWPLPQATTVETKIEAVEGKEVHLGDDASRTVRIGGNLGAK